MYSILSLADSHDWTEALSEIIAHDVYYLPEYCRVFQENGDGTACLFISKGSSGYVVYPFLKREIDLPFANLSKKYFDIITPYGYGGPTCSIDECKSKLMQDFGREFHEYCMDNGIVSEFVRFHPIIQNQEYCSDFMEVAYNRDTAYIDLSQSEDEIWNNMSSTHRNRVRKARTEGLTVENAAACQASIDLFYEMYIKTMIKNNAEQYYFFSREFFYRMLHHLKDSSSLFFVKLGSKVISGVYLLHHGEKLHYHFNASDTDYLRYGSNNLLIYETALWGKEQGYSVYHLGGGYTGEDKLFRFKRKFSRNNLFKFYIGKKVHNTKVYKTLCSKWREHWGIDEEPGDINYFPLYRYKY